MSVMKPSPEGACLLCGAIMPTKQLMQPYMHKTECPVFRMKRIPTAAEKRRLESDEGAVSRPSR